MDTGLVKIYLQDVDGITVGVTNYKVAKGAKIILLAKEYPTISLKANLTSDTSRADPMDTTKTFLSKNMPTNYNSFERPSIKLTVYLPVDRQTLSYYEYFGAGTGLTTSSTVMANYYLLFNMWLFNHKFYLTDTDTSYKFAAWSSGTAYNPGDKVSYTNNREYISIKAGTNKTPTTDADGYWLPYDLGLPINILQRRTDLYNNAIFSNSGIPVVVESIDIKNVNVTNITINGEENSTIEVDLTLLIDG